MVIIICLFDKRTCDPFSLAVKNVVEDLVYIDGHAQSLSYPGVIKGLSSEVVTDICIAESCAGEALESGIFFQAFYLVRLNTVAVNGTCIKFNFLGQKIRYHSKDVSFIVRWSLPVVIKAIQNNVLV